MRKRSIPFIVALGLSGCALVLLSENGSQEARLRDLQREADQLQAQLQAQLQEEKEDPEGWCVEARDSLWKEDLDRCKWEI